jgi:hypothetical protein
MRAPLEIPEMEGPAYEASLCIAQRIVTATKPSFFRSPVFRPLPLPRREPDADWSNRPGTHDPYRGRGVAVRCLHSPARQMGSAFGHLDCDLAVLRNAVLRALDLSPSWEL